MSLFCIYLFIYAAFYANSVPSVLKKKRSRKNVAFFAEETDSLSVKRASLYGCSRAKIAAKNKFVTNAMETTTHRNLYVYILCNCISAEYLMKHCVPSPLALHKNAHNCDIVNSKWGWKRLRITTHPLSQLKWTNAELFRRNGDRVLFSTGNYSYLNLVIAKFIIRWIHQWKNQRQQRCRILSSYYLSFISFIKQKQHNFYAQ